MMHVDGKEEAEGGPITRLMFFQCTPTTAASSRPPSGPTARSVARVFAHVNDAKPQTYWDYDALGIKWSPQERYEITGKVGRGKYSEVFSGWDLHLQRSVVIKVLKPVRSKKIKREILILNHLAHGPNIIQLTDLTRDAESKTPAFIFELVDCDEHRTLYPTLTDLDIRLYMFQLLRALHYAHSRGIMHRDVKPHNVMIDHKRRQLRLIDWGLAELYHAGVAYNVRVASRYYKGPELLVDFQEYDYSLDLWSFGCMLAGMVFKIEVFFHGDDNDDQLFKIVQVLGTAKFVDYCRKYGLALNFKSQELMRSLEEYEQQTPASMTDPQPFLGIPLSTFATQANAATAVPEAVDLLGNLLVFDHQARLTAAEALEHAYFDPVRHLSTDHD